MLNQDTNSFSFLSGLQTLTDTLSKALDNDELKLNSKVLSLSYGHHGQSYVENWSIFCAANNNNHSQDLPVDAVIMTVSKVDETSFIMGNMFTYSIMS